MIEVLKDESRLITVRFSGAVDRADYEKFGPWLEQRVAGQAQPLRLLVHAEDWNGWAGFGAAWEDLKLDMKVADRFERVAMVGDSRWQEWMTKLSDLLVSTQLRWFDRPDAAAARSWVEGSSE